MATRKVTIKMQKMTETEILQMVAKSTDAGFPVPAQTIIDASSKKTLAKLFDNGLVEMGKSSSFGGWYYYSITEKGREACK